MGLSDLSDSLEPVDQSSETQEQLTRAGRGKRKNEQETMTVTMAVEMV